MKKWITPLTAKTFFLATSVYLIIIVVNLLSPVRADSVFGKAFNVLVYIAPLVIVGEAAISILKERARLARNAQRDDVQS
ncbi:MAG: hypothetical protein MUE83_06115 [Tabrizicola sp.]|jgi:chromate transport protein ChrA|nr:hypothetical protein [Tabrizicola sp.]